jgi:hypothetical protein
MKISCCYLVSVIPGALRENPQTEKIKFENLFINSAKSKNASISLEPNL